MRNMKLSLMLLFALCMAAFLNGCGSSSKAGSTSTAAGTGYTSVAKIDETACRVCHSTSLDKAGLNIVTKYLASPHNRADAGCQGCHGGGSQHNGVGPLPYMAATADQACKECHDGATITTGTAAGNTGKTVAKATYTVNFGGDATLTRHTTATTGYFALAGGTNKCGSCHGAHNPLGDFISTGNVGCVNCHDINQNRTAYGNYVNDNNGVRAITAEFKKTSHHVTGRDVTNTDCAVCHLEGKKSGTGIVVDPAFHQKDDKIYLRNGNTGLAGNQSKSFGAGYAWQPSSPDYTLMDQFCFSCHNAAGAPSAVTALSGVTESATAARTALNPFGDTISNAYDQLSRLAVVGVYEQFDTGNSSHHAVRGAKYTSKNLTKAQFTNISTANYKFTDLGVAAPIKGLSTAVVGTTTATFTAQKVVGTMFETGKFTSIYTVGTTTVMADNSTLHCGDCHTVGQFKAGSAYKVDGTATTAVIGAHGSNNEYMLRNSNSDDTFNKDALVCFLCHKEESYNSDFAANVTAGEIASFTVNGVANSTTNGAFKHAGANSGWDCNGQILNSAGKTGMARLQMAETADANADGTLGPLGLAAQANIVAGKYNATSGSPIFGYSCAGCHNASDKKTFGGIHGNAGNASFTTYSGAKGTNLVAPSSVVSRKPYRFLPGLQNFRFNGGDNPDAWMVRTLSTTNKQGCYTLNGASSRTATIAPATVATRVAGTSPTKAVASGTNVNASALADDNGILGSWGACTDHAGSTYGGGRAVTRTILRPLTY